MIPVSLPPEDDNPGLLTSLIEIVRRAIDGTILPLFVDYSNQYVGVGTTSPTTKLHVSGNTSLDGTLTVNDSGADKDTRIEGDTDANLLFVDASTDRVGIGTSSPQYKLQIGDSGANMALGGTPTSNGTGRIKLITSNSVKNWQISNNDSISAALEFTPSTSNGGSTFTTPAANLTADGIFTTTTFSGSGSSLTGVVLTTTDQTVAGIKTLSDVLVLKNGTTTTDGAIAFDRTNEDLSVGDGSASQIVHMGAWKTWTPTWGGFSSAPTSPTARYAQIGKTVIATLYAPNPGTSNATTFTVTLPVAAKNTAVAGAGLAYDNTTLQSTPARIDTTSGSATADIYLTFAGTGWTNSGSKTTHFTIAYEAN